jgi:hypothetical protein
MFTCFFFWGSTNFLMELLYDNFFQRSWGRTKAQVLVYVLFAGFHADTLADVWGCGNMMYIINKYNIMTQQSVHVCPKCIRLYFLNKEIRSSAL